MVPTSTKPGSQASLKDNPKPFRQPIISKTASVLDIGLWNVSLSCSNIHQVSMVTNSSTNYRSFVAVVKILDIRYLSHGVLVSPEGVFLSTPLVFCTTPAYSLVSALIESWSLWWFTKTRRPGPNQGEDLGLYFISIQPNIKDKKSH